MRHKGQKTSDRKPIILLSDSACLLTSFQIWIGDGKSPSMWGNSDADIVRDIVQLLRERIEQGLFSISIKTKAHREDPSNEYADRWADDGIQSDNIGCSLPTNRPIFSWTSNGTTHQSTMNPKVKKKIESQVARKQPKTQTGSTAYFLTREDNSRDLQGKFYKDESVCIFARRRVLQCISYQFPCALHIKMRDIFNEVQSTVREKYYTEKNGPPKSVESV